MSASSSSQPDAQAPATGIADDPLARFAAAIRAYGGSITEVADLAAVGAYVGKLARARSASPRVVVERDLYADSWAKPPVPGDAADAALRFTLLEPCSPPTLRGAIIETDVGVGVIDHAVVETGQAVIYRSGEWGRLLAYLAPVYVGVVRRSDFVATLAELLVLIGTSGVRQWPAITFVAGCSVSADIENIPTAGVHGPLEFHVLVLNNA